MSVASAAGGGAREARHDAASDAIARAVLATAGIDDERGESAELSGADHLSLIAAASLAEQVSREVLQRAVLAARAAGVSWARIGDELGMTRQAAQQRFGGSSGPIAADENPSGSERWLGPVTAFDEMAELDLAGRAGWRTVQAAAFGHRMVRTDTQWEHRRMLWPMSLVGERAEGWQVGCRWFPWVYLVRDTGLPVAEPNRGAESVTATDAPHSP